MPNANLKSSLVKSRCSRIDPHTDSYVVSKYEDTRFGLLANLMATDGLRGKVVKVCAKHRLGDLNFVSCLRQGLKRDFSDAVGIGGVFQINSGKIKAHVMPDFAHRCLKTAEEVNAWLRFFEMPAPVTCLSTFISKDIGDLQLRLEHTHFFHNETHAGHYHYDTTPKEVSYEAYFVPCEKVYRLFRPCCNV